MERWLGREQANIETEREKQERNCEISNISRMCSARKRCYRSNEADSSTKWSSVENSKLETRLRAEGFHGFSAVNKTSETIKKTSYDVGTTSTGCREEDAKCAKKTRQRFYLISETFG